MTVLSRFRVVPWSLAFGLVALATSLNAQTVPSGGVSLIAVDDLAIQGNFWGGSAAGGPIAVRTIVPATGQSFTQAARIDIQRPNGEFYSSAVSATANRAVADGDIVLLHFFLRAIQTTDESGSVFVDVYAEGPAPDYTKSLFQQASSASEWTEYFLPFEVEGNYPSGQFTVTLGFGGGARPSILEIGGAQVLWYGKTRTLAEMPRTSFNYEGRALDAPWRAEAAARIEQLRKANYTVRVTAPGGATLSNVRVRVRLRRHAFPFGTAFVASRVVNPTTAENVMYRSKLVELFNAASTENDLKWPPWSGEWGNDFNQTQTLAALQWLKQQGFHLRGHVLVWPSARNLPDSIKPLLAARDPGVPQLVRAHIQDVVTKTREWLDEWDVLNEPYDNHDLMDVYGAPRMVDWFTEARLHHPTAQLYINDYGILSGSGLNTAHQNAYEDTIRYLVDQGAPIDGLGMQGHFSGSPTGMTRVKSILDRFANAFSRPLKIKITEFDVDTDDEQLQADYTRDLLTMAFSHPAIAGFQVWGFWEGAHWRGKAAMYRRDWSEKPSGKAFRELIHQTWQTDETKTTAASGQVSGRGFLGTYDVIVEHEGRTVRRSLTLEPGGSAWNIVVDPNATSAQVANLSTRGQVGTGENVMIAGFVVTGSGTKDVLIRGIGPRLGAFGVSGALANPRLQVFAGSTLQNENDNWDAALASVFGQAGAFALENDAQSAALRLSLPAGSYSAQLSGVGNTTGIGLIEVYDLDTGAPIKPVNLSTRGVVGTGGGLMIGGFVIQGDSPQRVLIRGIGPGLAQWITGYVANPQLVLYRTVGNDSVEVGRNDDWSSEGNVAEINTASGLAGAFPLATASRDAVLLLELEPGTYSAHLSGVGNSTGVGLIEIYALD